GSVPERGTGTVPERETGSVGESKSGTGGAPAASAAGAADGNLSTTESSDALVARLRALGCAPSLPVGTVVAVASGTLAGQPVIAVDLVSASGSHSFHAIAVDTCAVTRLS